MPKKLTIQLMQQLAQGRGGTCLSDTYVDAHSKLLWQCAKGHQWMALPNSVHRDPWCRQCNTGRQKNTIERFQALASKRGGRCLSSVYVKCSTNLTWQCVKGHEWAASPNHIQQGKWCPVCSGNLTLTIQDMHRLAETRGGKCLSDTYVNAASKLSWQCTNGHEWMAPPNSIRDGKWCPQCSPRLGERICREYFTQLFQKAFPKSRPEWLMNKAGNRMELDGYCAELGIAFEHQGVQHYSKQHYFHTHTDLSQREALDVDDALKSQLCARKGITLVQVPEIPNRLPIEQVRAFIKEQLSMKSIPLPPDFDTREVDFNRAYRTSESVEILNRLRTIAAERCGQCLSDVFVASHSQMSWRCAKGHEWESTPEIIQQGKWCPECARLNGTLRPRLDLPEMHRRAAARGGRCLSDEYINSVTHLLWECKEGHQWKATPNVIKQGRWCPKCARSRIKNQYIAGARPRKTTEDMNAMAAERGGKCLSEQYTNAVTKLLWECARGHQWEAKPQSVFWAGTWCPECARERRRRKAP